MSVLYISNLILNLKLMRIMRIVPMFLCGLVFASCGGNGAKPEFNEAKLQEFVSKLPDHFTNLNLDSTYYTSEYYHAWQDACELPSDGLCDIGSEEVLFYFVCGNDPCKSHSGKLDGMKVKGDTAYVDFKIVHRWGEETPHSMKLVVRDAQWVIANYDQTLSILHDYLKETTAYLQSDEFKSAAQSILDNPNASDGYKDCVRRSLKKVEDYFSKKQ